MTKWIRWSHRTTFNLKYFRWWISPFISFSTRRTLTDYQSHICCAMQLASWHRFERKIDPESQKKGSDSAHRIFIRHSQRLDCKFVFHHSGSHCICNKLSPLFSWWLQKTMGRFKKKKKKRKEKSLQYPEHGNADFSAWLWLIRFWPHMSLQTNWYVLAVRHGIWNLPQFGKFLLAGGVLVRLQELIRGREGETTATREESLTQDTCISAEFGL